MMNKGVSSPGNEAPQSGGVAAGTSVSFVGLNEYIRPQTHSMEI